MKNSKKPINKKSILWRCEIRKNVFVLRVAITFFVIAFFVKIPLLSPFSKGGISTASAFEKPAPERINQGPEIFVQLGHTDNVTSVAFSPDDRYALSGSCDNTLKLWDIAAGKELRTFTGHTEGVTSVTFSPDDRYALSGSYDNTLKLWDIAAGREIRRFTGHTSCVLSAIFSCETGMVK